MKKIIFSLIFLCFNLVINAQSFEAIFESDSRCFLTIDTDPYSPNPPDPYAPNPPIPAYVLINYDLNLIFSGSNNYEYQINNSPWQTANSEGIQSKSFAVGIGSTDCYDNFDGTYYCRPASLYLSDRIERNIKVDFKDKCVKLDTIVSFPAHPFKIEHSDDDGFILEGQSIVYTLSNTNISSLVGNVNMENFGWNEYKTPNYCSLTYCCGYNSFCDFCELQSNYSSLTNLSTTATFNGGPNTLVGNINIYQSAYIQTHLNSCGDLNLSTKDQDGISVLFEPNATIEVNETNICLGQPVVLHAKSGFSCIADFVWYEWYADGVLIATTGWQHGGTKSEYLSNSDNLSEDYLKVYPDGNTDYKVIVKNGPDGYTQSEATISVSVLNSLGLNQTVCKGESFVLNPCSANSDYYYVWLDYETQEEYSSLEIAELIIEETKNYKVQIFAPYLLSTEDITIYVNEPQIEAGLSQTICLGDTSNLVAEGFGEGSLSYQWSNEDTSYYTSVSPTINTNYMVTVTDENGCTANDTLSIIVNELPTISASSNGPVNAGDTATLIAITPTENNIAWSTGHETSTVEVTPCETTTYWVSAIDSSGCINHADVTVEVIPNILIQNISRDTTICINDSINLVATCSSPHCSYQWTNKSGNTISASPSIKVAPIESTSYIIKSTDGCSILLDTIQVNVDLCGNTPIHTSPCITTCNNFQQTYGDAKPDITRDLVQTQDGGFIAVGESRSYSKQTGEIGDLDIFVYKTDKDGIWEWSKTFGGLQDDYGMSIIQDSNGDFILCGYTYSFGLGERDIYVIKIDFLGNEIWSQTYGGSKDDLGYQIIESNEGGYALTAATQNGTYVRPTIIKIDDIGTVEWSQVYKYDDYAHGQYGMSIAQAGNNNYAISGIVWNWSTNSDIHLLVTDPNGNVISSSTFGRLDIPGSWRNWDRSGKISATSDNGFLLVGTTRLYGGGINGNDDIMVIKTDQNGNELWETFIGIGGGGGVHDFGKDIVELPNNDIVLAAILSENASKNNKGVGLIGLDASGNLQWLERFNGPENSQEGIYSLTTTQDNGLAFTGIMGDSYAGQEDSWLVKVCGQGIGDCNDTPMNFIQHDTTTQVIRPIQLLDSDSFVGSSVTMDISKIGVIQNTICTSVNCAANASFDIDCNNNEELVLTSTSTNATAIEWYVDGVYQSNNNTLSLPLNQVSNQIIALIASDGSCRSIETKKLDNLSPPSNFIHTQNEFELIVEMNTESPTLLTNNFTWDFGDGTTGNGAQTNHIYSEEGVYEVCLNSYNNCISNSVCRTITIDNSAIEFIQHLGDSTANEGTEILPIDDTYVVLGNKIDASGEKDILISRIDEKGDEMWSLSLGGASDDYGTDMIYTDNSIIVVGATKSHGSDLNYDYYACKIDLNGNVLWEKIFGDTDTLPAYGTVYKHDIASEIIERSDGTYLIAGYTRGFNGVRHYQKNYIVHIDADGDEIQANLHQASRYFASSPTGISTATDSNFIIFGNHWAQIPYWYITKTDFDGNELLYRRFHSTNGSIYSGTSCSDGGNAFVGTNSSNGAASKQLMVMKLDANQNILWSKMYGGNGEDHGKKIIETNDGGFAVIGYTKSNDLGANNFDVLLLKLDSDGNEQFVRRYNVSGNDYAYDIKELVNGYIIVGTSSNGRLGASDILLIKTDLNGNTECQEFEVPPTQIEIETLHTDHPNQNHTVAYSQTDINYTSSNEPSETELICIDQGSINNRDDGQINFNSESFDFKILPNPSNGQFKLLLPQFGNGSFVNIYNVQGQIVKEIDSSNSGLIHVDMSNAMSGVYFIEVNTGYKSTVKRIVIQK